MDKFGNSLNDFRAEEGTSTDTGEDALELNTEAEAKICEMLQSNDREIMGIGRKLQGRLRIIQASEADGNDTAEELQAIIREASIGLLELP